MRFLSSLSRLRLVLRTEQLSSVGNAHFGLEHRCFRAGYAEAEVAEEDTADFPGARVPTTSKLEFIGGAGKPPEPIQCYRLVRRNGEPIPGAEVPHPLSKELSTKMYETMVKLQVMDLIFYEAQRQGRFSFYMTSNGEEATVVGSAAALTDQDQIFAQYREQGALLWRGFTLQQMADQCFGNELDPGKGRQMPIHYGSQSLAFHTISSSLGTQLPHAVGTAYAMKLEGSDSLAATYFGDGAASEGDFHAALNFAATLEAPVLFICRNNGWAISTPVEEQYRGDGIAGRGPSYGVATVRVDGGDALAVYNAVRASRALAMERRQPVLIECLSYRSGHHSTSDDSSKYRASDEISSWKARDPVARFQSWMAHQGWWDEESEQQLRLAARREVLAALDAAESVPKPPLTEMFTDVYDSMPWNLCEQQEEVLEYVRQHPEELPAGMPFPDAAKC